MKDCVLAAVGDTCTFSDAIPMWVGLVAFGIVALLIVPVVLEYLTEPDDADFFDDWND